MNEGKVRPSTLIWKIQYSEHSLEETIKVIIRILLLIATGMMIIVVQKQLLDSGQVEPRMQRPFE